MASTCCLRTTVRSTSSSPPRCDVVYFYSGAHRFDVLPYCTEDWVLCRRLMDAGCKVLMPWAAPIGTGCGPRNPSALRELRQRVSGIPLIIDAGIGLPSHACQVMEWGFDGVLLNTAVSRAMEPVQMAEAFRGSVRAGRAAYLAGPMVIQELAVPSSPNFGLPFRPRSSPATLSVSSRRNGAGLLVEGLD